MTDSLKIVELLPEHASQAAGLHIRGISTGFISSLGMDFVTSLYEAIAQDENSFGFVAEQDSSIAGFIVFTSSLGALYKSIIFRKKGIRFVFLLAGRMFSPGRIKKVFETLFYPARIKKMNLPLAELLAVVVVPEGRRKGLAAELLNRGFQQCRERGIDKIKVLVGADNEPANKFYIKHGFKLVRQIENHGIISNIYVAETGDKDQ